MKEKSVLNTMRGTRNTTKLKKQTGETGKRGNAYERKASFDHYRTKQNKQKPARKRNNVSSTCAFRTDTCSHANTDRHLQRMKLKI